LAVLFNINLSRSLPS